MSENQEQKKPINKPAEGQKDREKDFGGDRMPESEKDSSDEDRKV